MVASSNSLANDSFLNLSVTNVDGIGPKSAGILREHGIDTVWHLLRSLPRAFEQRKLLASVDHAKADETIVVVAQLVATRVIGFGRARRIDSAIRDHTGTLRLTFFFSQRFHPIFNIKPGTLVTAIGKVTPFQGSLSLVHPKVYVGDRAEELAGMWPLYPESKALKASLLHRFARNAASDQRATKIDDWVPQTLLSDLTLSSAHDAYIRPHLGQTALELEAAQRRAAFDDMLEFQLAKQREAQQNSRISGLRFEQADARMLFSALHAFEPTTAQMRALDEAVFDMASGGAMNRLLHGEVGSGKTAIAASLSLHAARNGFQTSFMAPTEVLAKQHYSTIKAGLAAEGKRVSLLLGSTPKKERASLLASLAAGHVDVLIGTHALLTDDVQFRKLGLVIADEQHRFGVTQLEGLVQKGSTVGVAPHVLAMTATPIPRSIALTVYGDMDVSVLDELPKNRKPVTTMLHCGLELKHLQKIIEGAVLANEKTYVVYPLIEESEKSDLLDATQGFEMLKAHFGEHGVAMLHGRMKQEEKDRTLGAFVAGDVKLLVSTTVIEVGVHVPDAVHMVIMNAERFGLAQLHQLRGRVGRGTGPGFCHLLTKETNEESDAYQRLCVLAKTQDGFRIAEEDLKIRGPGDIAGTRQSGVDQFRFFRFEKHTDLIEPARRLATKLLTDDPALQTRHVRHLTPEASRI